MPNQSVGVFSRVDGLKGEEFHTLGLLTNAFIEFCRFPFTLY